MRYLLDTNIVSFLLKTPTPSLSARFQRTPLDQMALSSIVEAELRYGANRLPANAHLHSLLANFLYSFQVLPWDSICATHYADLRVRLELQGQKMSTADTMIAAHALSRKLTLVSNDAAFLRVDGLKLEDWTKGPQRA